MHRPRPHLAFVWLLAIFVVSCGGSSGQSGSGGSQAPSGPPASGTTPPQTEPPAESRLNIVLGRPTDTSIAVSVLADPGTEAYVEYGTAPGRYEGTTQNVTTPARGPRSRLLNKAHLLRWSAWALVAAYQPYASLGPSPEPQRREHRRIAPV